MSNSKTHTEMNVAKTILEQLGGNKFLAMTGAKNLIAGENFIRMNLTRNAAKAKWLKISLNSLDTYEMDFFAANKNMDIISKAKFENVYSDQLQEIFTKVTGQYTRL